LIQLHHLSGDQLLLQRAGCMLTQLTADFKIDLDETPLRFYWNRNSLVRR